ncbi:MAG: hypothetical protein PF484_09965, partial [Bacteroidales bacterium]|nr:hypothetical protein [Bacteroidales bacterium]
IEMYIVENSKEDKLELMIRDNGQKFDVRLMKSDNSFAKKSFPSLHFLLQHSKENGGDFQMLSHNLTGNLIEISYPLKSRKRLRLGNSSAFLSMLFLSHPQIHFIYSQISQKGEFLFDSKMFKSLMGKIEADDKEYLANLKELIEIECASIQDFA